ncbi:poly polymerase and DNA-ligase Zn-finger region-domain-containing protein [Flagelloscypha sp. PMI_526]|nr:poly polymerase and DNA-ligase Zn-finger region-domain-containing protein [Flagelloscypha sp. PMI_526]
MYQVEVSPNNRAKCRGPAPCRGSTIKAGEIRLGIESDNPFDPGASRTMWRHWECVTPLVIKNLKKSCGDDATKLPGFEQLHGLFQDRITKAFETGRIQKPVALQEPVDDPWAGADVGPSKKKRKLTKKEKEAASYRA